MAVILAIVFLGSLTFALVSPTVHEPSADTITIIAGSTSNYYVSLTSNDVVPLSIEPDNTIHSVTSNLTAASNTSNGYKIYASMSNNNVNGNRLYLDGDNTKYISPTTTTTLDTNSWGVSTDTTTNKSYTAMPLIGNELIVKEYTTSTPSATIPLTYAAKANTSIPSGKYKGEVTYSILANAPTSTILSTTSAYTPGGGTITISTPMLSSQDTLPTATVTIGGTTCTNPTVAKNANTGIYEVTCTIPAKSAGSYSVVVNYSNLPKGGTASYTASSQLTYTAPTVSSVSPTSRYTTGTQSITLVTNIPKDTPMTITSAQVGTSSCTSPSITNSGNYRAITCTSPSLSAGTYNVSATVTVKGGNSTTITKASAITYVEPPAITSVSPDVVARNGGQKITIITNQSSSTSMTVSSVTIGGTTCTSPTVTTSGNYRAITCTTPAKSVGSYTLSANVTISGSSMTLTSTLTSSNTLFDISKMQDMTTNICKATTTPTNTATSTTSSYSTNTGLVPSKSLSDSRDSQSYTVRKLADGNCWMTENLRLAKTAGNLTSSLTDLTSGRTFDVTNAISSGTWNVTSGTVFIYPRTDQATTNYGNLYNWYTATAGARDSSGSSLMNASSGKAADSICPKGWTLPTKATNSTNSYYNLIRTVYGIASSSAGSTALRSSPLNFTYGGNYDYSDGTLEFVGSKGYYWQPTVGDGKNYANNLQFSSSEVSPNGDHAKGYGMSVRCVAK